MTERIRIGVASPVDLGDQSAASGTPHRIAEALQRHCGEVVDLGPLPTPPVPALKRVAWRIEKALTGKRPRWKSTRACCRILGKLVDARLAQTHCDVLVSAFAGWATALADSPVPQVQCTDSTLPLRLPMGQYETLTGMSPRSVRETMALEARMLQRAAMVAVSSQWAAASVENDFAVPRDRITIAPLGANLDPHDIPSESQAVSRRIDGPCRLLFVGAYWQPKGGDIALETLESLEEMGISSELIVCGCHPPEAVQHPHMQVAGFLNKNDPAQKQRLKELFLTSNFLLVPTRSEAYGIVYCEANAFGLPAIGTAVGGVTEIIRDGCNGFALPLEARGDAYAAVIANLCRDEDRYRQMVGDSRRQYQTRLNWDTWGATVAEGLRRALGEPLAARIGPA